MEVITAPDANPDGRVLAVRDLVTVYPTRLGVVPAVDHVNFELRAGEVLGIVGDSGSGKTTLARSLLGLVAAPGRIVSGEILLHGRNMLNFTHEEMRRARGTEIAMIFQNPIRSFHPGFTIGRQLTEAVTRHQRVSRRDARDKAIEALTWVGMPEPAVRMKDHPHQFSGGMLQRVMIAMSLLNEPAVLVADEPTTALDVTIQAQILELIQRLAADRGLGVILVTHNLGMVASICDRVMVMYAGQVVEEASVDGVFAHPAHPYTVGLLDSQPDRATGARLEAMAGGSPKMTALPPGCRFQPRCAYAEAQCSQPPELWALPHGQTARCWVSNRHGKLPPLPDGGATIAGSGPG
ncbi:MAG: ABC transporter ATP-binding protein [bacterium]|nr:ABC transporter ATP-binding protein [bacterium]